MNYLADTVTLIHYLRNRPKLGASALSILEATDKGHHTVFLSAITLMEILYLAESNRITLSLSDFLEVIRKSDNYKIIPVDEHVVQTALSINDVPELHDRIIVATAVYLNVPILTPDHIISTSAHVRAVW